MVYIIDDDTRRVLFGAMKKDDGMKKALDWLSNHDCWLLEETEHKNGNYVFLVMPW